MPLEHADLEAIRLLIYEESQTLGDKIEQRFDQVLSVLDSLVKTDETREEENLALNEQIKRLDKRVATLERKGA